MKWDEIRHNIKWNTSIGSMYLGFLTKTGLFFLNTGRKLLRRSLGRCSWCGANSGFSASISKKGLRCMDKCEDKPYI